MNILRFLRSKLVSVCIIFLCLAGWSYLAALAAVPPAFIALSCGLCLFGAALVWLWQYLRARSRLQKLRRAADEIGEKAYLLGEMLECPADAVEEEYFEVMKRVSRAAVSAAEAAIRTRDEYGDYMEKWVHELKTPLTAASLILAGGGDAQKLRVQIRRADNLAESVLCYARLREPGSSRQISRVRLREAADEAVKGEMELLLAVHVRVEVEGDAEVSTDRGSVVFAVKQLLVNCAKYCKGGRVRIAAQGCTLTVEDDGPGVPAHELPRLFGRGFVGGAGQAAGGGTGMGLYLVRETCAGLGVRVEAASREGAFTRFTFTFPQ